MTTILLKVYAANESSELKKRYHVVVALQKLKQAFGVRLRDTRRNDPIDVDYEIVDWPDYEGHLVEFSKHNPHVRLFIHKYDLTEIVQGEKL